MLKVSGVYHFTVIGDGVQREILIPLSELRSPPSIRDNINPTDIIGLKVGGASDAGFARFRDETQSIHLGFYAAPPSDSPTEIEITALFGVERLDRTIEEQPT